MSAEEASVAAALAEAGMAAEAAVAAVASASATPAASEPSRAHATDLVLLGHLIASRLLGGDSEFAMVWKEAVVPVAAASRTDWQVGMCAEITRPLVGRVSAHTLPAGTVGRIASRADDGERWQLLVDRVRARSRSSRSCSGRPLVQRPYSACGGAFLSPRHRTRRCARRCLTLTRARTLALTQALAVTIALTLTLALALPIARCARRGV